MKTLNNFLHYCMLWQTEISGYRCRINNIKTELVKLNAGYSYPNFSGQYKLLLNRIDLVLHSFHATEVKIIHTINDNTDHIYPPVNEHYSEEQKEQVLFESIKHGYSLFVDLQQCYNNFLKEVFVPKEITKVIQLPDKRAVTAEIRLKATSGEPGLLPDSNIELKINPATCTVAGVPVTLSAGKL